MRERATLWILVLICLLFSVSGYEITTFTNGLGEENLSYTSPTIYTRYIDVPLDTVISLSNFTITGYNLSTNLTTVTIKEQAPFANSGYTNTANMYDGDWGTFAQRIGIVEAYADYYFRLNGSIHNATLRFSLPPGPTVTIKDISDDCINDTNIKIQFYIPDINDRVDVKCYNHTNSTFSTIFTNGAGVNYDAVYEYNITVSYNPYPTNIKVNISDSVVYENTGVQNSNNKINLSSFIIEHLEYCSCTGCAFSNNVCRYPLYFESNFPGVLQYSNINTSYIYNFSITDCTLGLETINYTVRHYSNDSEVGAATMQGSFNYSITNSVDGKVSNSYNFTSSSSSHRVCVYPDYVNFDVDYQIQYTGAGYGPFDYFAQNINFTNVTKYISLYVVNDTSQVLFNVKDYAGDDVQGALIHIQKYDIATDTYKTTEITQTDTLGNAIGSVVLNTEWYRILIYYDNILYLTDSPTKFFTTSRNYRINLLGDDYYDTVFNSLVVTGEINFTNTTDTFTWTYNAPQQNLRSACLKVEQLNVSGNTVLYNTCQADSQSGTLLYTITPNNQSDYLATAYVYFNNDIYMIIDTDSQSYKVAWMTVNDKSPYSGLYAAYMIIVGAFMLGVVVHPVLGIALSILAFFATIIMNLWAASYVSTISVILLGAIMIWRVNQTR